jgi:LPXTG-motif cell wall-anchored protein
VTLKGAEEGTTVTWENPGTCAPPTTTTPPLPVTGASLTSLVGVGAALVLVGGALLFVLRYRRRLGES